jgi:LEA14-like dessication related protein
MRPWIPAVLLALALGLALPLGIGCAGLGRGLEAPEVSLVSIEPLASNAFEQRFAITIRIVNPNEVPLSAEGIDLTLELNDRRLARALAAEAFTVPRLGDQVVELVGSTNLLDLFRQLVALPEAGSLDYVLRGRVLLADSAGWLRFSRRGSLIPEADTR